LTFCEAASIDIFSFVAFMCLSTPTLPFMTDFRLTRPGLSRRICQYYLEWGRMGASVVSVGAALPVPRPDRPERSGGTAGYCDDLLTVSVASCPLSTHVSLSLRAICPDRAQTRDLPAHPLWGVRDARAVRLWGLRSGVTTCTANQWAAEASKSIGLGGWQAIFVKLQPCNGVPNPAPHESWNYFYVSDTCYS
jgi:hypothetical protein